METTNRQSIFKVVRIYNPNDLRHGRPLQNYYRGKAGLNNTTYLSYITRDEACVKRSLDEKALLEQKELDDFLLESKAEWMSKWKSHGVEENFLKESSNLIYSNEFHKYGQKFKKKVFNSLNEWGIPTRDFVETTSEVFGLTKEQKNEMWKELTEIDREISRRKFRIEEFKKKKWGTGLYTNKSTYKAENSFVFGELNKTEVKNLEKEFLGMRDEERLFWDTILSFDTMFAEENMILSPDSFGRLLEDNLNEFFKENQLDPKKMTWGFAMHGNTENPHAHLFFYESEPNNLGQYRYKAILDPTSMQKLQTRIVLQAQLRTQELSNIRLLEKKLFTFMESKRKTFFLSEKEMWNIKREIIALNKNSIELNSVKENFTLGIQSSNIWEHSPEAKNMRENISLLEKQIIHKQINLLSRHSPEQIEMYFSVQSKLSDYEKNFYESISKNYFKKEEYGTWKEMKKLMVKNQSIDDKEHFDWYEEMKQYRMEGEKFVEYKKLTLEGQKLVRDFIENEICQTPEGENLLSEIKSEVNKNSIKIVQVAMSDKNIEPTDTNKMKNLKAIKNVEDLGIKFGEYAFINQNIDIEDLSFDELNKVLINLVAENLLNGPNGFYDKQSKELFKHIQTTKRQFNAINPDSKNNAKKHGGGSSVGAFQKGIGTLLNFGSNKATAEFEQQLSKLKHSVENELQKREKEMKVREQWQ